MEGDMHDDKHTNHGMTATVIGNKNIKSTGSYDLSIYPTDEFYKTYSTNNPVVSSWGAVAIVVLTSAFFFVYDMIVRREFSAKRELLQSKRKFVRFVSHEIRTPMNVVSMGLEMLQAELRDAIDNGSRDKDIEAAGDDTNSNSGTIPYWLDLTGDILENTQNAVAILND